MDADQVKQIADVLAEKIGQAAATVQPFAADLVHQVQLRGAIYAVAGGIGLIVGLAVTSYFIREARRKMSTGRFCDDGMMESVVALGGVIACVPSTIGIIVGLQALLCPYLTLLKL